MKYRPQKLLIILCKIEIKTSYIMLCERNLDRPAKDVIRTSKIHQDITVYI